MVIKIVRFLILIVFAIGIMGAGNLVWKEVTFGNVCPLLIGIPACYIILACFIIPLFIHLLNKAEVLYFIFIGLAFTIALLASILQFTGNGSCPKTGSGTPMCYYSLLIFSSLLIFKIIILRNVSKNMQSNY